METVRIFLACLIGSAIGSLLAIEFGVLWFVGTLIGGGVGYLVYAFKKVIAAIPNAWEAVTKTTPNRVLGRKKRRLALRVMMSLTRSYFLIATGRIACFTAVILLGCSFLGLFVPVSSPVLHGIVGGLFITAIFTPACLFRSFVWIARARSLGEARRLALIERRSTRALGLEFNIYTLAKGLFFFAPHWLYEVKFGVPVGARFVSKLFRTIHEDIRLLCGANALFGAIAGWYFGSVAVGALTGGTLGVANYWLVTKPLLKRDVATESN